MHSSCCIVHAGAESRSFNMNPEIKAYHELCGYTLALRDPEFLHQHVVDAFAAQQAAAGDKPIKLVFALVGLYLHVERQFTGRQVQQSHITLARRKRKWPVFPIPPDRGSISARSVLEQAAGPERHQMIHRWCRSVWEPYSGNRDTIAKLLADCGIA